jgi:hypothetical protein
MNQLHIGDSYSRQAQINWPVLSADGAVGDIKFQALGKPAVTGLKQQLESIFNPDLRTGEFVLSAVQNPNDVYRTILTQASAGPNIKSDV